MRRELGKVIFDLQKGETLSMPLSRPSLPLRRAWKNCASETARAHIEFSIYYTRLADSVLIFHAFAKKTQKTPTQEIALAQKRLREIIDEES